MAAAKIKGLLALPEHIKFNSPEYKTFFSVIDGFKGPGGLSLNLETWEFLNSYFKDKLKSKNPDLKILTPKEFTAEDDFILLAQECGKLIGDNAFIKPGIHKMHEILEAENKTSVNFISLLSLIHKLIVFTEKSDSS